MSCIPPISLPTFGVDGLLLEVFYIRVGEEKHRAPTRLRFNRPLSGRTTKNNAGRIIRQPQTLKPLLYSLFKILDKYSINLLQNKYKKCLLIIRAVF